MPPVSTTSDNIYAELFRHMRTASHVANAHYWRYDLPSLKLVWSENPGAELGDIGARSRSSDLNSALWNTLHPDDHARVLSLLANPPTETGRFEFRRIANDNSVRHLRAHYKLFRDANDKPSYIIGATHDISNEVLVAQQLQQQAAEVKILNERLERAAQSSQEGHWEADFATGKHWCSDVYRSLLGYGPEHDFSTMETYQAIAHPDELEGQYHMVMALKDGEAYERTIRLKHADGTWRWMQVRGSLKRDANGQPMRLTGNIRSVHEQTLMQKQLDEYQQRFTRAIKGTQDGLWELNLKTHELWLSPRCAEILGYAAKEVIQWNESNIAAITHIDDIEMVRNVLRDARRHGKPYDVEYRMRTKGGSWIWVNIRGTATSPDDDNVVTISGSLQDVTAAHEAREKLIKATAEAESANRAKSAFLANMSHELRTPMNGIIGMAQLLASTPLNETQREFADIINNSAHGLLAIINDVLDISKIEASKLNIEHIDMNLRDTVEEAVTMMATQIANKKLELIVDIEPDLPHMIKSDPHRIRQCILNLLSNAYKFTHQGQIHLTVTRITHEKLPMLRFSVRDTGIGITQESMNKLFRPFVQADSSTTRKFGGTGLGLSIVKRLIELMGGEINVESDASNGSCFWFTLPLDSVDSVLKTPVIRHTGPLLIISRNTSQRNALVNQLKFNGYLVDAATDMPEALMLLRNACSSQRSYIAMFVDEQLSGLETQLLNQQIYNELRLHNTQCILLTSIDRSGNVERFSGILNIRTLCKPIRHRELQKCLNTLHGQLSTEVVSQAPASPAPKQETIPVHVATAKLPGEVLLVEDNIVNQKVAVRFLQRLGARVTVANNGAEGLELLKRGNYALVLMDVQMPVMDGYEATRNIRELPSGKCMVPIVALTANATPEDRERCLAIGMNEFLTKPLQIDKLTPIVNQYCTTLPKHDATLTDLQIDTLLEKSVAEANGRIEAQVDLRKLYDLIGEDTYFLSELVDAYLQTVRETFSELKVALEGDDKTAIARAAHKLKGASSNMCVFAVSELASQLETQAHILAPLPIKTLINDLHIHVQAAIAELTRAVQAHKPAA